MYTKALIFSFLGDGQISSSNDDQIIAANGGTLSLYSESTLTMNARDIDIDATSGDWIATEVEFRTGDVRKRLPAFWEHEVTHTT